MNINEYLVVSPTHYNTTSYTKESFKRQIVEGILQKDIAKLAKDLQDKLKTNYQLKDTEKVFFDKGSTVPRYKFRDYAKDKELTRTIILDNADVVVLNSNTLSSVLRNSSIRNLVEIPKTEFKDIFVEDYDFLPEILYMYEYVVRPGYGISKFLTKDYSKNIITVNIPNAHYYNSRKDSRESLHNDLQFVESYLNKNLIDDVDLLKAINNGLEIDENVLDQIKQMLKSHDSENVGLAMQIMADSDYSKSEFELVLLLNEFKMKIFEHKNYKLKNFQSLVTYFNRYQWSNSSPINFANSIMDNLPKDYHDIERVRKICLATVRSQVETLLQHTHFTSEINFKNEKTPLE